MPFVRHEPHEDIKRCCHPEHNPPRHILLEPGRHTWECPVCGERQTFEVSPRPQLFSQPIKGL